MGLINAPVTPPTLTKEQKQAKVKRQITISSNALFQQMVTTFNHNMETIWANEDGLTPQEGFDALGTDAVTAITLNGVLASAINAAHAGTVATTPPKSLTANSDGTVTVGA